MIISISIIAWGKETTHTQHSHRHNTRVSERVISAKDRPSQRQRHTPTDAKRKGRAEGRRSASRPANRTQSQPHQPTIRSSPRAAGGVYSAPSHGGEKRRTVPPGRRGAALRWRCDDLARQNGACACGLGPCCRAQRRPGGTVRRSRRHDLVHCTPLPPRAVNCWLLVGAVVTVCGSRAGLLVAGPLPALCALRRSGCDVAFGRGGPLR